MTQRHGPVSKDDCVEIFISPNPDKVKNYYTFEINAIGTMLNRARTDWWSGPPTWEPEGVQYRTTFHGLTKKEESSDDSHSIRGSRHSFEEDFARDAAHTPPRDSDVWRLIFAARWDHKRSIKYMVASARECPQFPYTGGIRFGAIREKRFSEFFSESSVVLASEYSQP